MCIFRWLRALFDEADVNGDGTLDLKEIIRMMKRLNVGISQKILKKKFKVNACNKRTTKTQFLIPQSK